MLKMKEKNIGSFNSKAPTFQNERSSREDPTGTLN
jgi:hypothetical protein